MRKTLRTLTVGVTAGLLIAGGPAAIAITVPASSSRYSKFSLLGDYQRRYIKKASYWADSGKQVGDAKYSYLYSPTSTQYIKVTYKS